MSSRPFLITTPFGEKLVLQFVKFADNPNALAITLKTWDYYHNQDTTCRIENARGKDSLDDSSSVCVEKVLRRLDLSLLDTETELYRSLCLSGRDDNEDGDYDGDLDVLLGGRERGGVDGSGKTPLGGKRGGRRKAGGRDDYDEEDCNGKGRLFSSYRCGKVGFYLHHWLMLFMTLTGTAFAIVLALSMLLWSVIFYYNSELERVRDSPSSPAPSTPLSSSWHSYSVFLVLFTFLNPSTIASIWLICVSVNLCLVGMSHAHFHACVIGSSAKGDCRKEPPQLNLMEQFLSPLYAFGGLMTSFLDLFGLASVLGLGNFSAPVVEENILIVKNFGVQLRTMRQRKTKGLKSLLSCVFSSSYKKCIGNDGEVSVSSSQFIPINRIKSALIHEHISVHRCFFYLMFWLHPLGYNGEDKKKEDVKNAEASLGGDAGEEDEEEYDPSVECSGEESIILPFKELVPRLKALESIRKMIIPFISSPAPASASS
eukprot:Nk52_evm32s2152 gene=Nk52_evmTU32s2152